jgi:hypothetical protein
MVIVEELDTLVAPDSAAWDFVVGFGIGLGIVVALGC